MIGFVGLVAKRTRSGSTVDTLDPFEDSSGIALWQFNDDVTDESGNYNGSTSTVTYGTGKFGKDAVAGSSSASVTISEITLTDFGISFWGYPYTQTHMRVCSNNSPRCIIIYHEISQERVKVDIDGSASASTTFTGSGGWDHFVFTRDGSKLNIYVNNVLEYNDDSFSENTMRITQLINDAGDMTTASKYTDQMRVFNRGLTSTEVGKLYTETK